MSFGSTAAKKDTAKYITTLDCKLKKSLSKQFHLAKSVCDSDYWLNKLYQSDAFYNLRASTSAQVLFDILHDCVMMLKVLSHLLV